MPFGGGRGILEFCDGLVPVRWVADGWIFAGSMNGRGELVRGAWEENFLSWSGQRQHSIWDNQPGGRVGLDVDLYFTFYWDYGRVSEILENTDTFLSLCICQNGEVLDRAEPKNLT